MMSGPSVWAGADRHLDAVVEVLVVGDDRDVAVRVDADVRGPRRLDGGLDRPVLQLVQHGLDAVVGGEDRDVDVGTHQGDLQLLASRGRRNENFITECDLRMISVGFRSVNSNFY
jgi:hypothetical protein